MLCPQPQRAFAVAASTHGVEHTGSPVSPALAAGVDEASHELRELLGSSKGTHALLEGNRPLSSLSTSAGPTPGPDERGSPAHGNAPGVARERSGVPSQVRKVFVGGVPQDMNQDDLYTIFSEFGGVKKAWLQRYRTNGNASTNPPHNHRGFGFLIFYDGSAVEQLLGKNFSRFIMLKDGRRLEVKRAVSSSDMMSSSARLAGSSQQQTQESQAPACTAWPGGQSHAPQATWPADPRTGAWLASMASQQSVMLASVPWPGHEAVPQALPPAYSAMAGLSLASVGPRPPAVLLPPRGPAGPGERCPALVTHGPVPGVVAAVPGPGVQPVLAAMPAALGPEARCRLPEPQWPHAAAAPGGALQWAPGTAVYGLGVLPDASFMQPPAPLVFSTPPQPHPQPIREF